MEKLVEAIVDRVIAILEDFIPYGAWEMIVANELREELAHDVTKLLEVDRQGRREG